MKNIRIYVVCGSMLLLLGACEKFLSERHTSSLVNPTTLQDLQAMLDAGNRINQGNYSQLMDAAIDDFFVGRGGFERLDDFGKAVYLWEKEYIYQAGNENSSWTQPFHIIAVANTVLEEIPLVSVRKGLSRAEVEGSAFFHRAFAYLNLVQVYCKAYDPNTAETDWGLPLRLSADLNLPTERATLAETYNSIEKDLLRAIALLPWVSDFQTRPSLVAAHALIARLYLIMGRYSDALEHADLALSRYDLLIDYNEVDEGLAFPFEAMNDETLFFAYASGASVLNPLRECYVDTVLYRSYDEQDLRKQLFFKSENNGYFSFRGSYMGSGSSSSFIGLTVSELMLIQAECLARFDKVPESMSVLNRLLKNRYVSDKWIPLTVLDSESALEMILKERRKELLFRGGVRWADLKRLNRDPRFAKKLYRKVPGYPETYELPPGDNRYAFLIPQSVIEMTGIPQNDR